MTSAITIKPSAPDTFGHSEIKHPYSDYTLSDAVKLARTIVSISGEPLNSLEDVRKIIDRSRRDCRHTWITGDVAMDLLDSAIDGFDIEMGTRMVGADTQPKPREQALKEFVAKIMILENAVISAKRRAGVVPVPAVTEYTPAKAAFYFDQGITPEDAFKKLTEGLNLQRAKTAQVVRATRIRL